MAEPLESAARAAYEASWMNVEPPLPWSAISDEDRARCFAVARAVANAVISDLQDKIQGTQHAVHMMAVAFDDIAIDAARRLGPRVPGDSTP